MPKVLLVDDDAALRRLVSLTLGPSYEILEATNGVDAVALAVKEAPDVVFMDVRMPLLSGYEACRQIKAQLGPDRTRVVILTAFDGAQDRAQGAAAGADDYLTKPYSPLTLLKKLEALLDR
ncbi:MAG TPA: response regulator [Chloroflexota bacterium]|nr:response regulator [Chloroflexota bacterium]